MLSTPSSYLDIPERPEGEGRNVMAITTLKSRRKINLRSGQMCPCRSSYHHARSVEGGGGGGGRIDASLSRCESDKKHHRCVKAIHILACHIYHRALACLKFALIAGRFQARLILQLHTSAHPLHRQSSAIGRFADVHCPLFTSPENTVMSSPSV